MLSNNIGVKTGVVTAPMMLAPCKPKIHKKLIKKADNTAVPFNVSATFDNGAATNLVIMSQIF